MLTWFQRFKRSNRETKFFILSAFIYTAGVILPALYCYARLDYVRSYDVPEQVLESQNVKK